MQETLKLISIQHELGMAIGLDLRLKPMLKAFIQVALKRLGLAGVDVFIESEIVHQIYPATTQCGRLTHVLSVPESQEANESNTELRLQDIANSPNPWHEEWSEATSEYIYRFQLDDIGFISITRKSQPLDTKYLALLTPVFKRLAISCQASLEHEQLLQAIEARKVAESTITYQLLHDELTRLPNRRMLMDVLNQDIKRAQKKGLQGALLFIDLDRFKAINDTLGHEVGDQLLKAVAEILLKSVRKQDLVARLSGDEFVIVLQNIRSGMQNARSVVDLVLEKIYRSFLKPIQAGEHLLHISPSIGIEFYPRDDASSDRILRNADTAMYLAKAQGQYAAVFYESQMSTELEQRLEVEKQLQHAVETCSEFYLQYQPQYNDLGECIGAEALIRWKNAKGEIISPGLFIPVAEETGLILELGKWVLKTACTHIRKLERAGLPDSFQKISINVSAVQFNQAEFVDELVMAITKANILPKHLGIELTESALISNVTSTREKISTLKDKGIEVSVDDFGTGYSSLSYLNRFPITTLKIDQAFVRDMHVDSGNQAIVETIVALANSLNLTVIAEGVECVEELLSLQKLDCHYYQGFYFSKPVSAAELLEIMSNPKKSQKNMPVLALNRRHTDSRS